MIRVFSVLLALAFGAGVLSGCDTLRYHYQQAQQERHTEQSLGSRAVAGRSVPSQPGVALSPRTVSATGYAPISLQPGQNRGQKMLNAMRASKLQAYKELAAIVHGQYLFGTTQVSDMVLQNDQFNAAVGGVIRGARVVKTFPIQEDTYATILELDLKDVQRAYADIQP